MNVNRKTLGASIIGVLLLGLFMPLLVQNIPHVSAATLFSNGWEVGDDAWDLSGSDETIVNETSLDSYGQKYAAQASYRYTGFNGEAYWRENVGAATEGYIRVMHKTNTSIPNAKWFSMLSFRLQAGDNNRLGLRYVQINATHLKFELIGNGTTRTWETTFTSIYPWTSYEIYGKFNTADGVGSLWVNGTLRINGTYDFQGTTQINRVKIDGTGNSHDAIRQSVSWDMFEYSSTYIGPPTEGLSYTFCSYNTTRANQNVNVTGWFEITGIGVLDSGWLEHNNTGVVVNTSKTSMTGGSDIASFVFTLNSTIGKNIDLRLFANITAGGEVGSSTFRITTTDVPAVEPRLYVDGTVIRDNVTDNAVQLIGINLRDFYGDADGEGYWINIGEDANDFPVWGQSNWNTTTIEWTLDAIEIMFRKTDTYPVLRCLISAQYWLDNVSGTVNKFQYLASEMDERGIIMEFTLYTVNGSEAAAYIPQVPWFPYTSLEKNEDSYINQVSGFIDFWENVTNTMDAYPNVVYNLANEPHGNSTVLDAWLGTYTSLGGAEEVVSALYQITDNLVFVQWDWDTTPSNPMDGWTQYFNANCSKNTVYEVHFYQDGGPAWGNTTADVLANLTTAAIFSQDKPVFIGEISPNRDRAPLADELLWYNNTLFHLNNNSDTVVGWAHWFFGGSGNFRTFNNTEMANAERWGFVCDFYNDYYKSLFRYGRDDNPNVWTVSNVTINLWDYPYKEQVGSWSESWNAATDVLNISVTGDVGKTYYIWVLWNATDSQYPVNATLNALYSNSTIIDLNTTIDVRTSLLKIPIETPTADWVLVGYGLAGSGWMGVVNSVLTPVRIMGILSSSISYIMDLP